MNILDANNTSRQFTLNLTWILPDEVEMAIRFPMSHAMLVSSSPAEERDCCMKSMDRMKLTE